PTGMNNPPRLHRRQPFVGARWRSLAGTAQSTAALLAVAATFATGCQNQSSSSAAERAARVAQAINQTPPPGAGKDTTRPRAVLTLVSPDTLAIRRGHPAAVTLEVQYSIAQPALVKRAVLQLWNDAVGVIDTTVLPVRSEGTGTWRLTKPVSIGPLVRFTAKCASGETAPFVWGAPAQPTTTSPAIVTVTPASVARSIPDDPNPAHVGVPVTLFGNGLGPGCAVSASIDGRTVALDVRPQ